MMVVVVVEWLVARGRVDLATKSWGQQLMLLYWMSRARGGRARNGGGCPVALLDLSRVDLRR